MRKELAQPAEKLRYAEIRDELRRAVLRFGEGDRLPPERELSARFNVTRATVRRAMEDLGEEGFVIRHQGRGTFVTKKAARPAAKEKAVVVAFSVPGMEVPIHRRFIAAVEKEVLRRGASLLICNAQDSTEQERHNLDRLADQEIRDVIVMPFANDSLRPDYLALLEKLKRAGKRLVLFDQHIPEADLPVAMSNRAMIGYMATEHLIMLGHARIAYATSGRHDRAGMACLMGYRRALEDYGLEYREELVVERPLSYSAGPVCEAVKAMLRAKRRAFTAIATEHFSMTYGIVKALESLGLRPDADIGVVGAELFQNPALLHLTHTAQRIDEMGAAAVRLLLEPPRETMQRHVLIPPRLVMGQGCVKPKRRTS